MKAARLIDGTWKGGATRRLMGTYVVSAMLLASGPGARTAVGQVPACDAPEVQEVLAAATEFARSGDHERAVDVLRASEASGVVTCARLFLILSETYLLLGDWELARVTAEEARQVAVTRPESLAAEVLSARSLLDGAGRGPQPLSEGLTAELGEAADALRRALVFESSAPVDIRFQLARLLEALGRPGEAARQYSAYLTRHPGGDHRDSSRDRLEELRGEMGPPVVDGSLEPPKLVFRPRATYNRPGLKGEVRVRVVINEKGRVVDPKILQSAHPTLDDAALRLARRHRFKPAKLPNGETVAVYYVLTIAFDPAG